MAKRIFIYFILYIVVVGFLMYTNTTVLALGDPKFGPEGWQYYWPIWAVFYTPAVLLSGVFFSISARYLGAWLVVIFTTLQVSFIYDINWQVLALELILMSVSMLLVKKYTNYAQKH